MSVNNSISTWKESIRNIKLINSISKMYLPLIIMYGSIMALLPFLYIVYFSKIVDGIAKHVNEEQILKQVLEMIILSSILTLGKVVLDKIIKVKLRFVEDTLKMKISEKAIMLDYDIIEKKSTLQMLEKARKGVYSNGGISAFGMDIANLIQGIVALSYSSVRCIGMFSRKGLEGKGLLFRFMNSPISVILLLLILGATIVITFIITFEYKKIMQKYFDENVEANRQFGYFFCFMFRYAMGKDIRIYQMDKLIDNELDSCTGEIYSVEKKRVRLTAKNACKTIMITSFVEFLSYIFVGAKALLGFITIGELTLYIGILKQFVTSINTVLNTCIWISIRSNYIKNFNEFLDMDNVKNVQQGKKLSLDRMKNEPYEIEFRNVSFHYPNSDDLILKNVNIKIKSGSKVAIVGENGGGKSTFIKLLCRLYDPTEGSILLNGKDIKQYQYNEYLLVFSVIFQDCKLFSFPIANNISADEQYDEQRVMECINKLNLNSKIERFPKGIGTFLYNSQSEGVEISGGEAQKLAIARALYRNAPIVILDEPTSALDPIAELEIYENFYQLVHNKTAIFVSHRMSSCKFCDRILVFQKGSIIQQGNHSDLVKEEGLYYSLWNAQAQYYI